MDTWIYLLAVASATFFVTSVSYERRYKKLFDRGIIITDIVRQHGPNLWGYNVGAMNEMSRALRVYAATADPSMKESVR